VEAKTCNNSGKPDSPFLRVSTAFVWYKRGQGEVKKFQKPGIRTNNVTTRRRVRKHSKTEGGERVGGNCLVFHRVEKNSVRKGWNRLISERVRGENAAKTGIRSNQTNS